MEDFILLSLIRRPDSMLVPVHQYITLRTTENNYIRLGGPRTQTGISNGHRIHEEIRRQRRAKSDSVFTGCDVVSTRNNYIEFFPTQRSNYLGLSCSGPEKFILKSDR